MTEAQAVKDGKLVKVWQVRYTLAQLEKYADEVAGKSDTFPNSEYLNGASDALRKFISLMVKLMKDWNVQ